MNGVAQEMLHLVRATAPQSRRGDRLPSSSTLTGTEPVYRALAQLIGSDEPVDPVAFTAEVLDRRPALAKFVIDVLSGSSAGGINGIFLAKALANDQDLEPLGRLWMTEGDISVLLNDRESVKDLKQTLTVEKPPRSLLNGNRMYLKLLEAFTDMDRAPPGPADESRESRLADELDLYVTTTDLEGLLLPIRLSNRLTWERRYRNVFHFRYRTVEATGEHHNDFHLGNNPFLAFAARCTSAFPWAFAPMELQDIDDTVVQVPPYGAGAGAGFGPGGSRDSGSGTAAWGAFYPDYLLDPLSDLGPGPGSVAFPQRPFGDGGALDNKPFTYATSALALRQADVPVDRKLLFVEPDPGHPERSRDPHGGPDALEDFLKQAVFLPREETIRADLQAVFDRNRVIERVDRVLEDLDLGTAPTRPAEARRRLETGRGAAVAARDVSEDFRSRGATYGGYHQLRVEAVTDDLATVVARAAGLPDEPRYADTIRYFVEAWRVATYHFLAGGPGPDADATGSPSPSGPAGEPGGPGSTNRFLVEFDLEYRLRRLNLLQRRIDRLYALDDRARQMLGSAGFGYRPGNEGDRRAFREELIRIKRELNVARRLLRTTRRSVRQRPSPPLIRGGAGAVPPGSAGPSIAELVRRTGVGMGELRSILAEPAKGRRQALARDHYARHADAFAALGRAIAAEFRAALDSATEAVRRALDGPPPAEDAPGTARAYLLYSYNVFEDYDSVAFPLLYASDAGEADIVEVIRVSPLDAPSLADPNVPGGPAKVTGARYMHFGAFLDRMWRERDIMWGRLDAAEILIESLLPVDSEHPDRRSAVVSTLRQRAQQVIVEEQIDVKDRLELAAMLAEVVARTPPSTSPTEASLRQLITEAAGRPLNERMLAVLELVARDEGLLVDYVRETAGTIEPLPPRETLRTIGRGAHIMGDLLNGVAAGRGQKRIGLPFAWISRIGAMVVGMVEVATPRSFAHILGRHWLALLLVFEALAIAGGAVLSAPGVSQFGVTALAATVFAVLGVLTISQFTRGRRRWWVIPALLLVLVVGGLIALGVVELAHLGKHYDWIPIFGHPAAAGASSPSPTPTP